MCKAFSCIVLKNGDVKWQMGIDSHSDLLTKFNISDTQIQDKETARFAKVEITPEKGYLHRGWQKWNLVIDEAITPAWWTPEDEKAARKALREWRRQLSKLVRQKPIVHPFKKKPPKKITEKHLALLAEWSRVRASVRASVWGSVWDSVWASVWGSVGVSVGVSVRDSVRASVWDSVGVSVGVSVWDSVRASVWDSVGAYTGSFFVLPRESWKYTSNLPAAPIYPFQSCVDLWEAGLVPSYDGAKYRLHGGPDAKVLWEGVL